MDIAFPALLLFLLIAPGFIFREFNQRRDVRASEATPLSRATFSALLAAVVLNVVACGVVAQLGFSVRLGDIFLMLVQPDVLDLAHYKVWQDFLNEYWRYPLGYFALTWSSAFLIGKLWMHIASLYGFERRSHCLSRMTRGDAPWIYLLEGLDHDQLVDGVWVAATVDLGGHALLYQGLLADFELAEDGVLDRIVLSEASRRDISRDKAGQAAPSDARFYAIDGDRLVLKYEQMTSLNIRYVTLG